MYSTFGAPSGAFGGSNGDQSGTESRISTLILPLNGLLICAPLASPRFRRPRLACRTARHSATAADRASPRTGDRVDAARWRAPTDALARGVDGDHRSGARPPAARQPPAGEPRSRPPPVRFRP